ncbi:hypothetical protein C8J56DRAFT_904169 [Mycena floridula]|nr:hypothetical protein C8J56DRAFT_904169 [Mycena floridula]
MSFDIPNATEIVIHLDSDCLKSLQTENPSSRLSLRLLIFKTDRRPSEYFIVKLLPTTDNKILRLGRARPFDIGSTLATSGDFTSQTNRNINFVSPPDGWYAVKAGRAPGVYRGWTNTMCSALAGPSTTADWKYFRSREAAMAQFFDWASANELQVLNDDGTYRATLGSFVDLDKLCDDGGEDEEAEISSLLKEATEAYLRLSLDYLASSPFEDDDSGDVERRALPERSAQPTNFSCYSSLRGSVAEAVEGYSMPWTELGNRSRPIVVVQSFRLARPALLLPVAVKGPDAPLPTPPPRTKTWVRLSLLQPWIQQTVKPELGQKTIGDVITIRARPGLPLEEFDSVVLDILRDSFAPWGASIVRGASKARGGLGRRRFGLPLGYNHLSTALANCNLRQHKIALAIAGYNDTRIEGLSKHLPTDQLASSLVNLARLPLTPAEAISIA